MWTPLGHYTPWGQTIETASKALESTDFTLASRINPHDAFECRLRFMLLASVKSVSSRVSMSAEHLGCTRTGCDAVAQKPE